MMKILKLFLRDRGYYFYKPGKVNGATEFEIGNLSYGVNIPGANFAPWRNDKQFGDLYSKVNANTLVDIYRCYELWKLMDEALKISQSLNSIEIGVWRGGTAAIMANRMQANSAKGTLYLADTFSGVVKTGDKDTFYTGGEHSDTSMETVVGLLDSLQLNNYKILQGVFPDETAHQVPANIQFGLCHIDVDVYLSAKGCLDWIWDKLVVGGVVVFDDYGFHTCDGVTKLVEEQRSCVDRIVIHNLNGHGLIVKIK